MATPRSHSSKDYEQFSEELFQSAIKRIAPLLVDKHVTEIESQILDIVAALDGRKDNGGVTKQFTEWTVDELLSAQGRLALLRVNLGAYASMATAKTNFTRAFKIYQQSRAWNPVKTALEKEFAQLNKKVLKGDIEAYLVDAFWETTQKEVFTQELADRLTSLTNTTNQVLTAIKMMANHKTNEQRETRYYDQAGGQNER